MDGQLAGSLLLLLTLGIGAPDKSASSPPRTPEQLAADTPPPSVYDLQAPDAPAPTDPALMAQLGRTILALVLVIAIIYLCAKILPRLTQRLPSRRGQHMQVRERLALDAKHSIFLLDVTDGPRLLLGTGENGVRLLTEIPAAAPDKAVFDRSMEVVHRDDLRGESHAQAL